MGQVEHGVTNQHHQLFMVAPKGTGKREVLGLFDHAFSDPLPELLLSSPEFSSITAYYQGRFLLLFLLLVFLCHLSARKFGTRRRLMHLELCTLSRHFNRKCPALILNFNGAAPKGLFNNVRAFASKPRLSGRLH